MKIAKNKERVRTTAPLFILVGLCLSECTAAVPEYTTDNCDPQRLKGGIIQCVITSCDLDWNDENINDPDFWQTAIDAGKIIFTGRVKGSGFNNTEVTEDTDACQPPEVTGNTWQALIKDFNVDLTGAQDVNFWNRIVGSRNKYQVGFRTSQDFFFGFFPVVANRKLTMPDTCDNLFNREITFSWKDLLEPSRKYLSFLDTLSPTAVIS